MNSDIQYKKGLASSAELEQHLRLCESSFIPPLIESVDITAYAEKIKKYATTFEAWADGKLVAVLAAYINDPAGQTAFITNVSIEEQFKRRGIAIELLSQCIAFSSQKTYQKLELEVHSENHAAIKLYIKCGFVLLSQKNNSIFMRLLLLSAQ